MWEKYNFLKWNYVWNVPFFISKFCFIWNSHERLKKYSIFNLLFVSIVTVFDHKHFNQEFHWKINIFHEKNFYDIGSYLEFNCQFWSNITRLLINFEESDQNC